MYLLWNENFQYENLLKASYEPQILMLDTIDRRYCYM